MPIMNKGLRVLGRGQGIDNYGPLHDDFGVKGSGYFGPMKGPEGYSTEISAADDRGGFPLIAPTLNRQELNHLVGGGEPTDEIYAKAKSWADYRRAKGLSPFKENMGLRNALPME